MSTRVKQVDGKVSISIRRAEKQRVWVLRKVPTSQNTWVGETEQVLGTECISWLLMPNCCVTKPP